MTPTTGTTAETLKVQRTVFDLSTFDDVKLIKTVQAPAKVASVEDALAAVGNSVEDLLAVINKGLVDKARDAAYEDMNGFAVANEDGEPGDQYQGTFADDKKSKLINGAVLNFAKMFAGGSWDSASKEQKRAHKDAAVTMIRSNPAMLQSIQG